MNIRYLKYPAIDKSRWDHLIDHCANGNIYAHSWYLNYVSPGWEALVYGDYEAVMPLTHRSKYVFNYLTQPPFCQQLGVFGNDIKPELVQMFLNNIPRRFRLGDIHLNYANQLKNLKPRVNYVLDLNRPYGEIVKGYTAENLKNLRKSESRGARITEDVDLNQLLEFFQDAYGSKNKSLTDDSYQDFKALFREVDKKDMAHLIGVTDEKGNLCCAGCFFVGMGRAIYVMGAPNEEGRRLQATHTLVDGFIRKHAGLDLLLDFEGSEIPSVAHFYEKFGPVNQPFYMYHFNRLPFPLNLIKR